MVGLNFQRLVFFATIGLVLCASVAIAEPPVIDPGQPAEIQWTDRSQLLELTNRGFVIDQPRKGTAKIWLTPAQFDALQSEGWSVRWIPDKARETWEYLRSTYAGTPRALGAYHTYADMAAALQGFATQYPDLCRLSSIGKSVQGRDLWMMKISDHPDIEEEEPEVRYISSMHGDEPVGMELLLNLIELLLSNYSTDSRIQRLVNEEEIWILPLMNPDGYEHSPPRRANANGYDLNRNFPDIVNDPNNTPTGRQKETQLVMAFSAVHNFVLSANFHGGALVANYPLDTPVDPEAPESPDDDFFHDAALTYSVANARMYASEEFPQGIVIGANWYIIHGGMQDYMYHWMGGRELTIELDDDNFPPESRLSALWDENREAMLDYLELAIAQGVRGRVLDVATSEPFSATIVITGREQYNNHPLYLYNDPDLGDYYCLLQPGTWELTFTVKDYPAQVVSVEVTAETMTRLDVYFPNTGVPGWNLY